MMIPLRMKPIFFFLDRSFDHVTRYNPTSCKLFLHSRSKLYARGSRIPRRVAGKSTFVKKKCFIVLRFHLTLDNTLSSLGNT